MNLWEHGFRTDDVESISATKSYTPSKARLTPSKAQAEQEDRHLTARQVNLQWAAVIIVGLVIFGFVLVFGSGTGGNLDQVRVGGHG